MSNVELIDLSKRYGETLALARTSLSVREGEFFALLGPSGCGKTTTLRIVAGFVRPDSGEVIIGGTNVTAMPPERRGIGMVFQNYAIFPHMHVFDNIAFGLRMRKMPAHDVRDRVKAAMKQVELLGYEARYQRELSGGEQQRVALARAMINRPALLLADEPSGNLDPRTGERVIDLLWKKAVTPERALVIVTHEPSIAERADRIFQLNAGKLDEVGHAELSERMIEG